MPHLMNKITIATTYIIASQVYAGNTELQQIQELRNEIALLKLQTIKQNQFNDQNTKVKREEGKRNSVNFITKNGSQINLYGFVRADAAYQFEGGDTIFNRINKVALDEDANKYLTEDRLDSTLTTTRIGLDFNTPLLNQNLSAKVELDFRGGDKNDTVRLRHAYLNLNNWLIGQTTSSFLSTETTPEMVDFNGVLGSGTYRTPMIRYNNKLNNNTQYFLGLERANEDNRLPTATAKISHKFANGKGILTGRGEVQEVRAREVNDSTAIGWGVGLGVKYEPENMILNLNYSHVSGDNKYMLYNTNNYISNDDDIDLVDLSTFTIGATYKFNPKLRSTLAYSAMYYDNNVSTGNDNLQQAWLNVMYNPIKPITFALEYVYGERETVKGLSGTDSRLEVMAKYDF
ncbi:DcaP family trimeric outer membrane transporter [Acinetobacter bohemicus]|uniref:DcaP family trimeric outer membrane transporter n=1 Tax=Acinetobacter bohemicus TaxID=1435036 RepID=UPI00192BC659|nr:DcaP family trimeric outer membrane transporter [Acinetobacter bohemicus]CAD9196266.1 hypothetical protein QAC21B_02409 [Acinetobacter bohemicus]